jgi:hypothetical protein
MPSPERPFQKWRERLDQGAFSRSAGIAQLVEQRIRNAKVVGSIPISGTNFLGDLDHEVDLTQNTYP